jgi:voltage-gated potassium channel
MRRLRMARAAGAFEEWERRTDRPLLVLAVLFAGLLVLPYVVGLTPDQRAAVALLDGVFWLTFAVDYAARLYLSPQRWAFVRSHMLDLLVVVVPMLRPLRALRVIRVLRIGALIGVTHVRAGRSLHVRMLAYVLAAALVVVVVAAAAVKDAESDSDNGNIKGLGDALWWALTTVTTVGYGDRYPTTAVGRVIAAGLMLAGIALVGVVSASIAAWFVERLRSVQHAEAETRTALAAVLSELQELRNTLEAMGGHNGSREHPRIPGWESLNAKSQSGPPGHAATSQAKPTRTNELI